MVGRCALRGLPEPPDTDTDAEPNTAAKVKQAGHHESGHGAEERSTAACARS